MACLFCDIIAGEIPADIVFEDDDIIAFRDVNPRAPVHILIIPRKHISGMSAAEESDKELLGRICLAAAEIAAREEIGRSGYRLVVNSGPDAGQAVDHLHFHLLGGRPLGWPPG
ncbi:MAG: histidine triad nucleotide-binding protein [Candidatus Auribacterota bacterium]|nr:histidine triad nucleotide-binding protein [Candidatus Auribacterota bacterium]